MAATVFGVSTFVIIIALIFFSKTESIPTTVNPLDVKSFVFLRQPRSCGGPGEFVALRMSTCSNNTNYPCRIKSGTEPQFELEYIPSENFEEIGYNICKQIDGECFKAWSFTKRRNVSKGVKTIFQGELLPEDMFVGKVMRHEFRILKSPYLHSNEVEVCAEADFLYT